MRIIIPAKNEVATIGRLVRAASQFGQVVVVDDGSSDGTGQAATKAGAEGVWHESSRGIGPSIMDGWRMALAHGADRIVVMDAGGSHSPNDIPSLLASKADVVIGSRFVLAGEYQGKAWRAACSRFMSLLCNLSQKGEWIRDWTSGFRLYSARAARQLLTVPYSSSMHGWQIEVLAWAKRFRFSIKEVPIRYVAGRSSLSRRGVQEAFDVLFSMRR